jgi:protein SCO1/2
MMALQKQIKDRKLAGKVDLVSFTVDPQRDTPQVLRQYLGGFDPTFVGLYGTDEETARTAKEFKVFYQKVAGKTPTSYSMDHTAGTYIFDRDGHLRLFVKYGASIDPLVDDLKKLL